MPFKLKLLIISFLLLMLDEKIFSQDVYFSTGFKISEVQSDKVMVWARLCSQPRPNPIIHQRRTEIFRHPIQFDESKSTTGMDGGVEGAKGYIRFILKSKNRIKNISSWYLVDTIQDFCASHPFKNLKSQHNYQLILEGKAYNNGKITRDTGFFKTAPNPNKPAPLLLTTSSCQYFWSYDDSIQGFRIYNEMAKLKPDLFVQTGDYVYYDKPGPMATNPSKARHKWHAMNAWSSIRNFFKQTPIYLLKDDHDLLSDDVHSGSKPFGKLTYEDGLQIWRENVPLFDKPYRTLSWGKHIQFWFMEGREFRSDHTIQDNSNKTIWGNEQKEWFIQTVKQSKAKYKIVISPTPIVGPDRDSKVDNHANKAFLTEGNWVRSFLSEEKMIVVNGDRHWQYVSKDKHTGLLEFGSGPVSDFHAQGWSKEDIRPEHKFLSVAGGFLSLELKYEFSTKNPYLTFKHFDVNGKVVHEEIVKN